MSRYERKLAHRVESQTLSCIGCNDCLLACPVPESRLVTIGELNAAVNQALGEFVMHYNEHRPHQSRDQRPPNATDTGPVVGDLGATRVRRRKVLDGLINEYSQAA